MNFTALSLSKKIILASAGVFLVSLIMPWVDFGFGTLSGLQQQGYIFSVIFIYPVLAIFLRDEIKQVNLNIIASMLVTTVVLFFMQSKIIDGFNFIGIGLYIGFLSCVALVIGLFMYKKDQKSID